MSSYAKERKIEAPVTVIGHLRSGFKTKFGIPRQSGLALEVKSSVVFEPEFRNPEAFRGLDSYSHIWLLWKFSETERGTWNATVRPPRLGGNTRVGVFATRSPFRPNPIGLSCVKLDEIEFDKTLGPVLHISGADLMNGTPIYDVKPYVPYADRIDDAAGGIADAAPARTLEVEIPPEILARIPEAEQSALRAVLAYDPRPAYQDDPGRIYGFEYSGMEIRFTVHAAKLTIVSLAVIGNERI